MATPMQIDAGQYYEGKSAREMIEDTRHWLGVGPTDTFRYSDSDVVKALNYGQNRFAKLTGCLPIPAVIVLKANVQSYRLPYNTLRVMSARYYSGDDRTDYYEMDIVRDMKTMQRLKDASFRGTTGEPKAIFPSYRGGNVLLVGVWPIPTVDGASWSGTPYGVLTSATEFTIAGNITGVHKDGFPSSAFLVDAAGRNLVTQGALVGYPVFNITDGSNGIITAIGDQAATNDKVTVTLAGGTDNDWDEGDSFQIPMGEYGTVLDGDNVTNIISSFLGTIADIAGSTGNMILDIARKPLPMSASLDTFICEIPSEYQDAVVAYAVYHLGRGSYNGVMQAKKAVEAMAIFDKYVMEFNRSDELLEESDHAIDDRGYEYLE